MINILQYLKANKILLHLIIIFFITRYFFFILGLQADSKHLPQMWQLLHPDLLAEEYFKSLFYLHFQPPIWNALFGIFVKIFGTDYEILSNLLNVFNICCSLIITIYFYFLCKEFRMPEYGIYLLFIFFIGLSPSLLMYENFIHYTNLTVLLFFIISYQIIKFGKNPNLRNEIKIYISIILLMYTWSAFSQPIILIIFGFTLYLLRKDKKYLSFFILIITFFISSLPSIKNKIVFNHYSGSFGPGLGLIQVLKRYDYKYPLCSFNLVNTSLHENIYKETNNKHFLNHPSLIGKKSKHNSIAFIHRAKSCLPVAVDLIKNDPIKFIKTVKFNLISSHGHFAFDFGQQPKNWNNIFGFFEDLKNNNITKSLKVRILQLYHLLFHLFFIFLIFKLSFNFKERENFNISLIPIYYLYAWIIFVSHIGTGFELERMRHTGHVLHVIFFIFLFKNNFNLIRVFRSLKL